MDAWLWRWGNFLFVTSPDSIILTIWRLEQLERWLIWEEPPFSTRQCPRTFSPCRTSPGWPSGLRAIETGAGVRKAKPSKIDVYACVLSRERLCDLLRSIWQPNLQVNWALLVKLLEMVIFAAFESFGFLPRPGALVSSCPVWCFFHHLYIIWMDTPMPLATSDWFLPASSWATAFHCVK